MPQSDGPQEFIYDLKHGVRPPEVSPRAVIGVLLVIAALFVFSHSFIVVQAGERAVIFNQLTGVMHYQLAEGMHFNIPILWEPEKYDVKTHTYTMSGGGTEAHGEHVNPRMTNARRSGESEQVGDDSLSALTADGLPVTLDMSVRFHIDPDKVWRLHQDLGREYVDKVVRPQSRSIARMEFAEFPVIDVYGKRQIIVDRIQKELRPRLASNYIVLDEVLLRDIRFPKEFQDSIEQKQVAQQEAQRMVFEVDRARSEKQQRIIEAQGEASAIRKKAEALAQNPQLIQYEYVRRLPKDTKIIVVDGKTIISLGDVLGTNGGK